MRPLVAAALFFVGCGGVSPDPGVSANLYIGGAQFVPGSMPTQSGGPTVVGLHFANTTVFPGAHDQPILGTLEPTSTAVALGLAGDRGYFVVPAGIPDTEAPTEPTFKVALSFARTLALGTRALQARAVDAQGRFGSLATLALTVAARPTPLGPLVIHLAWDTDADLDLHLIDPSGVEIWSGQLSGDGATLDVDSNADCQIDGRNQENVVYPLPPPNGHYVVRVDTFSLCGQVIADWRVDVLANETPIGSASGTSYQADTRGAHGAGAGRTALTFDLP